jgi:hypothetical protein
MGFVLPIVCLDHATNLVLVVTIEFEPCTVQSADSKSIARRSQGERVESQANDSLYLAVTIGK